MTMQYYEWEANRLSKTVMHQIPHAQVGFYKNLVGLHGQSCVMTKARLGVLPSHDYE